MQVRLTAALQPGPSVESWARGMCHRCNGIREVVPDVAGLTL